MLIGIVGTAGSGKSTAARVLVTERSFYRFSFATPLKEAVARFFGIPVEWCESEERKSQKIPGFDFTLRQALQFIGTEGIRNHLGSDVHIIRAQQRMNKFKASYQPSDFIFDDVRFQNEGEFITSHGGLLVHIVNPIEFSNKTVDHASEKFGWVRNIPPVNYMVLENPKTPDSKVEDWIETFRIAIHDIIPIALTLQREYIRNTGG